MTSPKTTASRRSGERRSYARRGRVARTVLPVDPVRLHRAQEELRAVGAGASVGHRECPRAGVLQLEVLVLELLSAGMTAGRTRDVQKCKVWQGYEGRAFDPRSAY